MKVTVSAIKADIGAIGGHTRPSDELLHSVTKTVQEFAPNNLLDYYVGFTGDDIHIVMSHEGGTDNSKIHKLA